MLVEDQIRRTQARLLSFQKCHKIIDLDASYAPDDCSCADENHAS
jgi:hypothetical protein